MRNLVLASCFIIFVIVVSSSAYSSQIEGEDRESIPLVLRTIDNVTIQGELLAAGNDKVIIYCHRLLRDGWGDEFERMAEVFSQGYDLIAISFRGHGSSYGSSSVGGQEILDLRAAVSYAKNSGYRKVAVVGAGMGGTIGVRAALIFGNIDALVVISPSGFAPDIAPFSIGILSDIALGSAFGRIPLQIVTNIRLGERYSSGFPVDILPFLEHVPTLIIHSSDDRYVSMEKLEHALEERFASDDIVIVPGSRHAEDLIERDILAMISAFLDEKTDQAGENSVVSKAGAATFTEEDIARIRLSGDLPIPERVARDELRARFVADSTAACEQGFTALETAHALEEVLALRGYICSSVSVIDTVPNLILCISTPRIRSVSIKGNHFLKGRHLESILCIDGDYYNAYELDAGIRRVSEELAVESVLPTVRDCDDGTVDIQVNIHERKPYRFLLATKFTDMDKYFGVGVTWNELNPNGIQYEGIGMIGAQDYEFLTAHRLGKNILGDALRVSTSYFDIVKSRDDLDYIFSRQEVRERGGDVSVRYRISSSIAAMLTSFGKRYLSPVSLDHPVSKGTAFGVGFKLDISGSLPFQGPARFGWWQTSYYRKTGPNGTGDFHFDTYQFNCAGEFFFLRESKMRTVMHGGWVSGEAPPQDLLSLGGMHTLPGYTDDAFIDARMILVGQELYLSARNVVDETSVWAPLRLIVSFHAGTVWGVEEDFDVNDLRTDVVIEFDYKKMLRVGIAVPTGESSNESPRFYIGWGDHVY